MDGNATRRVRRLDCPKGPGVTSILRYLEAKTYFTEVMSTSHLRHLTGEEVRKGEST